MKRAYRWGIVLAMLLALPVAVVLWLVKKSYEKIIISKETTYITQPLRKDGTVDYLAALNERSAQGITPENNAAVPFWQAMGPGEIRPEFREEYFRRLGMAPPPEKGAYFITLENYANGLAEAEKHGDYKAAGKKWSEATAQLDLARTRRWSAKEFPILAGWLSANEKPLAVLVEASKRPRRYDPMLAGDGLVISALLPALRGYANANQALLARAMLRLNDGNVDEAWADLLACRRLGRLAGQGPRLIDAIVGWNIESHASAGDQAMLQHIPITAPQVARMRADIAALPPTRPLADTIDVAERFEYLDIAAEFKRVGLSAVHALSGSAKSGIRGKTRADTLIIGAIDWNQALRIGNPWYDRMAEACRKPTRAQRAAAILQFSQDLQTALAAAKSLRLSLLTSPREGLTRWAGLSLVSMLFGGTSSVANIGDRAATQLELTKLGFALAAYRAEKGSYPAKLADLTPKYVATVPKDPFNDQDLHYTQQGEGYLLYSVGVNGKDDGGKGQADRKELEDWDDLTIGVPAESPKK
jgi:hypothetical protein